MMHDMLVSDCTCKQSSDSYFSEKSVVFALILDVNVGFQQAAHRVLIEDDATLSQFNLIIKTKFPLKGTTKSKYVLAIQE